MEPPVAPACGTWTRRLSWLLLIWAASVTALGVVAFGFRLVMRLVGMTA